MTGEITLSGLVLPVGGIREKAMAARRHGIKTFVLPQMNEPDLAELPAEVRNEMTFVPARTLEDVLKVALPPGLTVGGVAFYISGHGFGHASRQIEIINALGAASPAIADPDSHLGTALAVRTHAPRPGHARARRDRYRRRPDRQPASRRRRDDPARRRVLPGARRTGPRGSGAPPRATASTASSPTRRRSAVRRRAAAGDRVDRRLELHLGLDLRRLRARNSATLPGSARRCASAYASASAGWRLPMHGGFETIAPLVDLPFVARHARHPRAEVRSVCGLPAGCADRAAVVRRLRCAGRRSEPAGLPR